MKREAAGFILIAVVWTLAALALLAAYIDGVATAQIERARLARTSLGRELDRRSTRATVTYLLATGRMNHRGLILETPQRFSDSLPEDARLPDRGEDELSVTGQVYAGLGDTRFAVQDENGLASVNSPRVPTFGALLRHVGVARDDVALVVARVEDYIDPDGALRVNGAEAGHYRSLGLSPPPNWIMASPPEMQNVLGLDDVITDAQWRRLLPLLSIRQSVGYNFNTMHPEVLAAFLDMDRPGVESILDARAEQSVSRLSFIAMQTGKYLAIDPEEMREIPSDYLRISLWHEGSDVRTLEGIELTPFSDTAPWRTDYRYDESASAHDTGPPRTVATPLFQ